MTRSSWKRAGWHPNRKPLLPIHNPNSNEESKTSSFFSNWTTKVCAFVAFLVFVVITMNFLGGNAPLPEPPTCGTIQVLAGNIPVSIADNSPVTSTATLNCVAGFALAGGLFTQQLTCMEVQMDDGLQARWTEGKACKPVTCLTDPTTPTGSKRASDVEAAELDDTVLVAPYTIGDPVVFLCEADHVAGLPKSADQTLTCNLVGDGGRRVGKWSDGEPCACKDNPTLEEVFGDDHTNYTPGNITFNKNQDGSYCKVIDDWYSTNIQCADGFHKQHSNILLKRFESQWISNK
eukprot:957445_1